jgi:hypothetical protein
MSERVLKMTSEMKMPKDSRVCAEYKKPIKPVDKLGKGWRRVRGARSARERADAARTTRGPAVGRVA